MTEDVKAREIKIPEYVKKLTKKEIYIQGFGEGYERGKLDAKERLTQDRTIPMFIFRP